jgi:hypothetical protein
MCSAQSCQQAIFFQPGLACRLAWPDPKRLQARLKIKDLSCSLSWPGLACPAGQTRPIDVSDFSNTSYSIILHLSVVLVLVICLFYFHKIIK